MGLFSRNFRDEIIQIKKKKTRGGVNIPWRWKILSPNLFVYIECVVSIPRMIRTRGYSVSDLGRRYSGVPARACSLYQGIYIYIYMYQSRKYHVLVPRDGERDRENLGGEECILVTGKSVVYIRRNETRFPAMVINPWANGP